MKNKQQWGLHILCVFFILFIEYSFNKTDENAWSLFYILYLMCFIDITLTYLVYRKSKSGHGIEVNPLVVLFMKIFKNNWVYPAFLVNVCLFFVLSKTFNSNGNNYFLFMFLGYYVGVLKYNYIILKSSDKGI